MRTLRLVTKFFSESPEVVPWDGASLQPESSPFEGWASWLVLAIAGFAYLVYATFGFVRYSTDESEFIQATIWTSQGKLPMVDFWEHHTPLQWMIFAPAGWIADHFHLSFLATTQLFRFAQFPFWILLVWLGLRLLGSPQGASFPRKRLLWGLLGISPAFFVTVFVFRQDLLSTVALLGALVLLERAQERPWCVGWAWAGALVSLAAQANLRMVFPGLGILLIYGAWPRLISLRGHLKDGAWALLGLTLASLPMMALYLARPGATAMVIQRLVVDNADGLKMVSGKVSPFSWWYNTLGGAFALSITFLLAVLDSLRGAWVTLRTTRFDLTGRPGPFLRMTAVAMIAALCTMNRTLAGFYHFQFMMVTFALASALWIADSGRVSAQRATAYACFTLINAFSLVSLTVSSQGLQRQQRAAMDLIGQSRVMALTPVAQVHRADYSPYWFWPAHMGLLITRGQRAGIDPAAFQADPPEAILASHEVHLAIQALGPEGSLILRHFIPLSDVVWIPGLNARIPGGGSYSWKVLQAGTYRAIPVPAGHPWFRESNYREIASPESFLFSHQALIAPNQDVTVPVAGAGTSLQVMVNGHPAGPQTQLVPGDQVTVANPGQDPQGIVLLRDRPGTQRLFMQGCWLYGGRVL